MAAARDDHALACFGPGTLLEAHSVGNGLLRHRVRNQAVEAPANSGFLDDRAAPDDCGPLFSWLEAPRDWIGVLDDRFMLAAAPKHTEKRM